MSPADFEKFLAAVGHSPVVVCFGTQEICEYVVKEYGMCVCVCMCVPMNYSINVKRCFVLSYVLILMFLCISNLAYVNKVGFICRIVVILMYM